MSEIEAWVIYPVSPGRAPRTTDNPLFPWAWGEAIAVLPGDATPEERAAALAATFQATHLADDDRSDALQLMDRSSYFSGLSRSGIIDGLNPYLQISPARNVRYVAAGKGETRGRILFDVIHADEM